ncbi:MBL fold metallo-hydrolase [Salinicoccus sp. ID82-1]|uniref:MBL fold metallo-hydrolase n=1 Tax=Salinicoccus sp. ID82-1 TaxID=2820269 RepID=UPI001F34960E|nr:MBL fold metallo-hydrolase [Salinicoccus sp. ID82-1]MCG1010018.1 MBL fold metallo-hydrolase [Salinicoccus sp. ID82-1]
MKVIIIGMWNSFPKGLEPTSGYLIQKDGVSILLDAGSGVAANVQKYTSIHDIDHIFLSHYHHDHAGDIEAFMLARKMARQLKRVDRNLKIYGPESGTIVKTIRRAKYSTFMPIRAQKHYTVGPFQIEFHRNEHPVETYAMRVTDNEGSVFVHTSDSSYRGSLVRFAFGADLLIIDCKLYEGFDGKVDGHMNAEQAGRLASKSDAQMTLLANLPHHGELEVLLDSAKQHPTNVVRLAEAGMKIEI